MEVERWEYFKKPKGLSYARCSLENQPDEERGVFTRWGNLVAWRSESVNVGFGVEKIEVPWAYFHFLNKG